MALFLFQHQHTDETCPTKDEAMMKQLVKHTTPATAREFGVNIVGEAVVRDEHTLMMVLDAADEATVRKYVEPFAMVGSVKVKSALTCEEVAEQGCGSPA